MHKLLNVPQLLLSQDLQQLLLSQDLQQLLLRHMLIVVAVLGRKGDLHPHIPSMHTSTVAATTNLL